MKRPFNYIVMLALGSLLFSCKKDNYVAPTSLLTGKLVYQGQPILVDYNRVPYEMFQYGFGKVGPINGAVAPEGTYSQLLFDGEYKLIFRPGQGPFLWPQTGGKTDSISISVAGNTLRDIEVTPYHMVRTPQFSIAAGKVTGTFKIEKIITGANAKNVEKVALFINKTIFVGNDNSIGKIELAGTAITDPNNVSLNVNVPTITPTQNYVFARVGIKTAGVEDWIFSPVQKLTY